MMINNCSCWLKNKEITCRVHLCRIKEIIFPLANRVDPYLQELPDLGLLFAKVLKGVSMR